MAIAAGLGSLVAGLVTTVPVVGGSLIQMISPWGVGCLRSYRRWVVLSAALQAASLVWLMDMTRSDRVTTAGLFLSPHCTGPVGWRPALLGMLRIEHLVPKQIRPTYCDALATTARSVSLLIIAGGILLRWQMDVKYAVTSFAWLFGIARSADLHPSCCWRSKQKRQAGCELNPNRAGACVTTRTPLPNGISPHDRSSLI